MARGCEITNKSVLFPGQGTFTHSAHTVAPHSLSAPPLTNHLSGLGTGLTVLLTFAGLQLTRVNRPKTFNTTFSVDFK